MDEDRKFSWPAVLYETDSLAGDFLSDPEAFAARLGIQLSDLACPDEAHRYQSFFYS